MNARILRRLLSRQASTSSGDKSASGQRAEVPFSSDGRKLVLETGSLARFADGAAVARVGNTAVLVTAVSKARETPLNFLPLTVDFRLKAAAAGRIPTNFLRRELGPSDAEILTSRMIDRSLRPMFPPGYNFDTQMTANVLSLDGVSEADVLAVNAASAALAVSDIPFPELVGAVRVGLKGDAIIVNPSRKEQQDSPLNLVLVGRGPANAPGIVMIEAEASEVKTSVFRGAIYKGFETIYAIVNAIGRLRVQCGKPKRAFTALSDEVPPDVEARVKELAEEKLVAIFTDASHDKISRDNAVSAVRNAVSAAAIEADLEKSLISPYMTAFAKLTRATFRRLILETKKRCDGRGLNQIRQTSCSVGLFRPLHGSALFQRGQTQVLSSVTFDSPDAAFRGDPRDGPRAGAKFMLHYEFPSYATNEIASGGRANRRELGHGALAEKGLRCLLPADFPFTVRLSAEVLESNGSSSMASICGGSLALMDAGVPIPRPAAGVAMGLVTVDGAQDVVLTDISGIEDYMGDMDLKVGGTRSGLTAVQLDVKVPGISLATLKAALTRASHAHSTFLGIMDKTIAAPREGPNKHHPEMTTLTVPPHKMAQFMGIGGYKLRRLRSELGVSVSALGDGEFSVFAPSRAAMAEATTAIDALLEESEAELEFGAVYTGRIVEVRDSGVMVRIGAEGARPHFLPNSQLDSRRVAHASALGLAVGQEISVKCFGREPDTGRLRLSRKALLSATAPPTPPRALPSNPWAKKPDSE